MLDRVVARDEANGVAWVNGRSCNVDGSVRIASMRLPGKRGRRPAASRGTTRFVSDIRDPLDEKTKQGVLFGRPLREEYVSLKYVRETSFHTIVIGQRFSDGDAISALPNAERPTGSGYSLNVR